MITFLDVFIAAFLTVFTIFMCIGIEEGELSVNENTKLSVITGAIFGSVVTAVTWCLSFVG